MEVHIPFIDSPARILLQSVVVERAFVERSVAFIHVPSVDGISIIVLRGRFAFKCVQIDKIERICLDNLPLPIVESHIQRANFPDRSEGNIAGNGFGKICQTILVHTVRPTGEHIAHTDVVVVCALSPFKLRHCRAGEQSAGGLVGKDLLAVHAVGVGHGISRRNCGGATLCLPCGAEAAVRRLESQENDIFFALLEPGDQAVAILVQNGGRVRRRIARRREAKVICIVQRRVDAQPVNVCNQRERLHLAALRPGGYGQRDLRAQIGLAIPRAVAEPDGNVYIAISCVPGQGSSAKHLIKRVEIGECVRIAVAVCEDIIPFFRSI